MIRVSLRSAESEQPAKGITGNGRFAIAACPAKKLGLIQRNSEAVVREKPAKFTFALQLIAGRPPERGPISSLR